MRCALAILFVGLSLAAQGRTENVVLVTLDGLRWQELFRGADNALIDSEVGGARDILALRRRFWRSDAKSRRERLMPWLWSVVATRGQLIGDRDHDSEGRCTNGHNFSYPGYNELLTGKADPRIDSNAKRPNPNVTVLEWLHRQDPFRGKVAVFSSWDVFPAIVNAGRSGIPVNAGWDGGVTMRDAGLQATIDEVASLVPRYWHNVRYDVFTMRAAREHIFAKHPRVIYIAIGETDDWAHAKRYDLYLDAAWRSDRMLERLWAELQADPFYAGTTTLILTTDHGRGEGSGWTSHGKDIAGSEHVWLAALGPDTPASGVREGIEFTQAQVAPTLAAALGTSLNGDGIAAPIAGVVAKPR